ncbi:hypothetical protein ACFQV2_18910 [Actinokineospora soli]|uniref:Uncharacterized protein n=1 Tax=Actinokineospora soli TaxID=1048753 RepID=A0ABW2TQ15_9PSEU
MEAAYRSPGPTPPRHDGDRPTPAVTPRHHPTTQAGDETPRPRRRRRARRGLRPHRGRSPHPHPHRTRHQHPHLGPRHHDHRHHPSSTTTTTTTTEPPTTTTTTTDTEPAVIEPGEYAITLTGTVSGQDFTRDAQLSVTGTIAEVGTTNGVNALDLCLVAGFPAATPEIGAVWFGSNTGCFPTRAPPTSTSPAPPSPAPPSPSNPTRPSPPRASTPSSTPGPSPPASTSRSRAP